MAVWNGPIIHLDSKHRTVRNVVFETVAALTIAQVAVAWILSPVLDHLAPSNLAIYTAAAALGVAIVWLLTRRNIRGADPGELFP